MSYTLTTAFFPISQSVLNKCLLVDYKVKNANPPGSVLYWDIPRLGQHAVEKAE